MRDHLHHLHDLWHRATHVLHHAHNPLHCIYFALVAVESNHFYAFAAFALLVCTTSDMFGGES